MKRFLLTFVKGLIPGMVDAAILGALARLHQEIDESKHLKPAEKEATKNGAGLLAERVKEELNKQLNQ